MSADSWPVMNNGNIFPYEIPPLIHLFCEFSFVIGTYSAGETLNYTSADRSNTSLCNVQSGFEALKFVPVHKYTASDTARTQSTHCGCN